MIPEPVDLDALEKDLACIDAGARLKRAFGELRKLWDMNVVLRETLEYTRTERDTAEKELEKMRARKERLGDPATWFPTLEAAEKDLELMTAGQHPLSFPIGASALAYLCGEASALLERAKE